jgi:aminoglycoside phosphotransferase family enzyme/adenylate kinase family enzyme
MASPSPTSAIAQRLAELQRPEPFGQPPGTPVILHETHISWVFLCGEDAYKVKKPIQNDFIDYSTLDQRRHCCEEEIRLNGRYVDGLYLEVVAITDEATGLQIGGSGEVVDYAVRMRRFAEETLLIDHLHRNAVEGEAIVRLAQRVADFHRQAKRSDPAARFGTPQTVRDEALANLDSLADAPLDDRQPELAALGRWTEHFLADHHERFAARLPGGFIRECHGDLHAANVIRWEGQFVPFDGIEFNPELRWIDVLADVGFLGMDLVAQGHLPLSRIFLNAYLEETGDYGSLELYRFYVIYRALVRAKVAAIRGGQSGQSDAEQQADWDDCRAHIDLATEWTTTSQPSLWITHGVSGSGKSTGSAPIITRRGALRIRSDIERKRTLGNLAAEDLPGGSLYSREATEATYRRLETLARQLLDAGFPVVVDATFLQATQRQAFYRLAEASAVPFHILHFDAPDAVLQKRIRDRGQQQGNVSDADLEVLAQQRRSIEPLTEAERSFVVEMPQTITAVEPL